MKNDRLTTNPLFIIHSGFLVQCLIVAALTLLPVLLILGYAVNQLSQEVLDANALTRELIIYGATALIFSALVFFCFYKFLKAGISDISLQLQHMIEGNLTKPVNIRGCGEIAKVMTDLQQLQESLVRMLINVRDSGEDIVHNSAEITAGVTNLSSRTETSAERLESSAASMEQITTTVKHSTQNTSKASEVARNNADVAITGSQAMQEVAKTMNEIREWSSKISDIISTIDGIAFQTNLLALNASVEAARAGESGKGFAVVASEVGVLAQRSAEAAREIKTILSNNVQHIEQGTNVVQRATATMQEIFDTSHEVDKLLDGVNNASREQSIGIEQLNEALAVLDSMSGQNAALAAQTVSSAAAMKNQASALVEQVAQFQLPEAANASMFHETESIDINGAIDAHRQWKVKLRKAIAHNEQLDDATISADNQCALGKWLYQPNSHHLFQGHDYEELLSKHADFHSNAGAVARMINHKHYDQAEKMIGAESEFSKVSNEVCTLLSKYNGRHAA